MILLTINAFQQQNRNPELFRVISVFAAVFQRDNSPALRVPTIGGGGDCGLDMDMSRGMNKKDFFNHPLCTKNCVLACILPLTPDIWTYAMRFLAPFL